MDQDVHLAFGKRRIRNSDRVGIIDRFKTVMFKAKDEEHKARMTDFTRRVIRSRILEEYTPQVLRQFDALPTEFFDVLSTVYYREPMIGDLRQELCESLRIPPFLRNEHPLHPPKDMLAELELLRNEHKTYTESKDKIISKVSALVHGAHTFKSLLEVWPEGLEFCSVDEAQITQVYPLAVNVNELRKLIGSFKAGA